MHNADSMSHISWRSLMDWLQEKRVNQARQKLAQAIKALG